MFNKKASIILAILFCTFFSQVIQAQNIHSIDVEGNKKTKSYIILRELPYHVGDSISLDSLASLNQIAKEQLINTSLFEEVVITILKEDKIDSNSISVHIKVKERWYFFPRPYFRWVDRNFSQWGGEQHRSLDRVNYGINLSQSNVTGNNDKLVLGIIGGYTRQNILRYQFPFIDKKLHYGLGMGWLNYSQKEINYITQNDKQVFFKTIDVIRKGYRANFNLLYRPNLYERHSVQVGFGKDELSDSAFLVQPAFLPNHKKSLSYMDLTISFSKTKFDYNAYPTQGSSTEFIAFHRLSANSNLTSFQFRKLYAYPFTKSNFIFVESNSTIKLLPNYNYTDSRLVGYGNLQFNGLEYYVIDGNAATIFKTTISHSLGSIVVPNPITKKFLPTVKYDFWLKAFVNLGYVYSDRPVNSNKLANTLIRTAGVGLDIISIYDFVLKIDYSVNQLGDKGLYLHGGINF